MSLQTLINQVQLIQSTDDIPAFKACISDSYDWLENEFTRVDVDSLVLGRAEFVDALLSHAWQLLDLHKETKIALVAVGGYGRGQLQPYSDIDLLLLSPSALNQSQQNTIGQFITFLWDIGLDIGQSVRTIKETVSLARSDVTIATNLVEARLLTGNQDTFLSLNKKLHGRGNWTSKDFFIAKSKEQQIRHSKFKGTSYNLEPNVKESPGCLRDIQNIGWIAKKHFKVMKGTELVQRGYFTEQEFEELLECRSN